MLLLAALLFWGIAGAVTKVSAQVGAMLIVGARIALCAAMSRGVEADPRAKPGAMVDDAAPWALELE